MTEYTLRRNRAKSGCPGVPWSILLAFLAGVLTASGQPADFSGRWELNTENSKTSALPFPPDAAATVVQQDIGIRWSAADGSDRQQTFLFDGTETRSSHDADTWSSVAKWENATLVVKTEVSGGHTYHMVDRWQLSPDRSTLTIARRLVTGGAVVEVELVYTRVAVVETDMTTPVAPPVMPPATAPPLAESLAAASDPSTQPPQRRAEPDASAD
jgi:hypothetical protein